MVFRSVVVGRKMRTNFSLSAHNVTSHYQKRVCRLTTVLNKSHRFNELEHREVVLVWPAKRASGQCHLVALTEWSVSVPIDDQNVSIDGGSVSIEDQSVSIGDQNVSIDDQKDVLISGKQTVTSPLVFILSFLSFLSFPGAGPALKTF